MPVTSLYCESVLLGAEWTEDVTLLIDQSGAIAAIEPGEVERGERAGGPVVPGMANVHCHAFQRAMAGLAEHRAEGEDSFWTWREMMYRFVDRIGPDELAAIAAGLYMEMLKAGYTSVGEFHYLHNDPSGEAYADRAELSKRVIEAARDCGIGLTLLPVLYAHGGFGDEAPAPRQRRFVNNLDAYVRILEGAADGIGDDPQLAVGLAPHSLRAVGADLFGELLAARDRGFKGTPVHIHVAEQTKEVAECLSWCGMRPVEWLLANAEVDDAWCVVHATHMTGAETSALAQTGAVAGLCPSTEANLGDGIFPAVEFLRAAGRIAIGSDSNVTVNPREELRWLEYGQRLIHGRRNLLAPDGSLSTGASLWRAAARNGARALGRPIGEIAPGRRADLIVLDRDHPTLYGRRGDGLLDAFVFGDANAAVTDVMVGGRWCVRDGAHVAETEIATRYRRALDRLGATDDR